MASVVEGVVAKGVSNGGLAAGGGDLRDRMNRAYSAGEPVRMAVDECIAWATENDGKTA